MNPLQRKEFRLPIFTTDPAYIVVDLFCGAGGVSTGFVMARDGIARVIACVNHDAVAIVSHLKNHPGVIHFEEDIRALQLGALKSIVKYYRRKYPKAKLILWASLECTNFSKAKGGLSRDADSRTLADHLHRYIHAISPEYVMIENVVEFKDWGPIQIKPKTFHEDRCDLTVVWNKKKKEKDYHMVPVKELKGQDFRRWCFEMIFPTWSVRKPEYKMEWKQMNSADFGAYTSRNRLFGCFAKDGLPIIWPTNTHIDKRKVDKAKLQAEKKKKWPPELFGAHLKPWKAVKEVLDFSDEGISIFGRKKDLKPKTLERIYAGLLKYIAGGKDNFLIKYNSMSKTGHYVPPSVDEPCPVISCQNRLGVIQATHFISKYYSGDPDSKNISIEGPAATIKCKDGQALVNASFLSAYYGNGFTSAGMENPAPTLCTKDRLSLIKAHFIDKQYGSGGVNVTSIEKPAGTITANDKHSLITNSFITRDYSSGGQHSSVEQPLGAISTVNKSNVINTSFIDTTHYGNNPADINQPHPTITANHKWSYLVNPSWYGNPHSVDHPAPVIVARQDKAPLYLYILEGGDMIVPIYPDDIPEMVKIKEFMALYGIVDIKQRMLKVQELKVIQGFPKDYTLMGNQTDQKKFIGNSVVPHVVKAWIESMYSQS